MPPLFDRNLLRFLLRLREVSIERILDSPETLSDLLDLLDRDLLTLLDRVAELRDIESKPVAESVEPLGKDMSLGSVEILRLLYRRYI
jgi:hypothetical protein